MSYKLYIIFLFSFGLLYSGCKKYPEDKFISFRSSEKRLTRYKWKISEIKMDGNLVNDKYDDSLQIGGLIDLVFEFSKKDNTDESYCNIHYETNNDFHLFSSYSLNKKYESFSLAGFMNDHDSIEKAEEKIINNLLSIKSWNIRRLYTKEFIIKNTLNYEITFKGTK